MMRLRVGVDVGGGRHDRTAIVAVETLERAKTSPAQWERELFNQVVFVERMKALTPVDVQCSRIVALMNEPVLRGSEWYVDATGFGAALVDLLKNEYRLERIPRRPYGLVITGGRDPGEHSIPKEHVVRAIITAYQTNRLGFARGLPLLEDIVRELIGFVPTVTPDGRVKWGNDPSSAEYDDLVTALGLALQYPRRGGPPRYIDRTGVMRESRAVTSDPY